MSRRFTALCVILVFSTCVGTNEGNGNWKQNRENLQKDIVKFKEMAEKIEDEIEDFYDQYSDKWPKDEYVEEDENTLKLIQNKFKSNSGTASVNVTNNFTENDISPIQNTHVEKSTSKVDVMEEISSTEAIIASKWPKFEDILLEMGKKYDWKNDRWIKVKKKIYSNEENHAPSHDRHKFRYNIVKLNRSKSRRNVVIAVTAVR